MDWIRRSYDADGLTQYPVGRHLRELQDRLGGAVILCLDVSGSMHGSPLTQAIKGSRRFISEALDGHYQVGVVFWHHDIADSFPLTRDRKALFNFLARASVSGGNNIVPTLLHCERELDRRVGDLVIAIFGDGDLGNPTAAKTEGARLTAKNIRIITCGVGQASATELGAISSEIPDAGPRAAQVGGIAEAIAGMAATLKRS